MDPSTVEPKGAAQKWSGKEKDEEIQSTSANGGQVRGTILQVGVAYALLECALWTLGRTQTLWALAVALWVTYWTLRTGETAESAGVSVRRFWLGMWIMPASVSLAGTMLLAAWAVGSIHDLHGARTPFWHFVGYVVWALVQQFLTQSFIYTRVEALVGGRRAVLITGVLFGFAHIPNPVLMAATLVMGWVFSDVFRRYRNLYPLAIAHAVLGLALAIALPESATHRMRVGIAWWN